MCTKREIHNMTRVLIGVIVVASLVALAAIAALIVVTVRLTEELDVKDKECSPSTVVSDQQADPLATCETIQDVAIVGAGIAGSYAAWRMRNADMSVALYEYSNRIGGRCHTVHFPGIPDVNVELGAMRFIPRDHLLTNVTIHALGLDVIDFQLGYGSGDDNLFYLRGKHLRYSEIAANAPYNLLPEHRIDPDTFQWEIFKNYTDVDSSVEGYDSFPDASYHRSLDDIPLYQQSRKSFYAKYFNTDTEQYLKDMTGWDSFFVDVAAANWLPVTDPTQPSVDKPVKTVSSGFQSIPETMVQQFLAASSNHSLHRNHHLKSLMKHKDGHYVLAFQPTQTVRGVTTDNMNIARKHTCAKKVLLAIPRLALEYLDWEVLKHPELMDIIKHSLKDAKAGKMYFAYSDTWWRNLTLASSYAISSTLLRQTYDFAMSPSTGRGVLNPGYPDLYTEIWRDSQHQGNLVPGVDDDNIAMSNIGVDLARSMYASIFNISVQDMPQPDYAVMGIWDQYPIEASWYSWRSGYVWETVENKMTRPSPDDDVFIISNTFSKTRMQGWIEGALQIVDRTFSQYFPAI